MPCRCHRYAEDQSRGPAVSALRSAAEHYLGLARSDRPSLAHIPAEERATVVKECEAALSWLSESLAVRQRANATVRRSRPLPCTCPYCRSAVCLLSSRPLAFMITGITPMNVSRFCVW